MPMSLLVILDFSFSLGERNVENFQHYSSTPTPPRSSCSSPNGGLTGPQFCQECSSRGNYATVPSASLLSIVGHPTYLKESQCSRVQVFRKFRKPFIFVTQDHFTLPRSHHLDFIVKPCIYVNCKNFVLA